MGMRAKQKDVEKQIYLDATPPFRHRGKNLLGKVHPRRAEEDST